MNRLGGEVRYVAFLVFLSVVTMGCMIAAWDVLAEGSFDRTLNVTGPADLEVSTGSGSITVRAGTANLIQIHGTLRVQNHRNTREGAEAKVRALASNPPIEQSGSVIRIGRIEDRELRENVSISYEIVAPEETRLRARTGSGSQTVEGIRGPAEIDTGSGSLTVSNIAETVNARTGSGGIELRSVKGRVEASSGSGSVQLPANAAFDLDARADSGSISINHPLTIQGVVRKEELHGKVRGGGPLVYVRSGSGRIEIN